MLFRWGTHYQCRLTGSFNSYCLTHKDIPLSIQVPLVGQAASHDIEAVVVAGLHWHQTPAVWAVHHFQQRPRSLRRGVHLYQRKRKKNKKISPQSLKQKNPTHLPQGAWDRAGQKQCSGVRHCGWPLVMCSRDLGNRWRGLGLAHLLGGICHSRGTQTAPISAKHYLHHVGHPVGCGTPPRAARTGTPRGQAALRKLREGSKMHPSQKMSHKAALSEPCCKHMLKMMMLGYFRKRWDIKMGCLTWSLYQTHQEQALLLSGAVALPGQSPSRALQHRDQLLYITFKSLNTAFTWQIPGFIYTQHSSRSVTPFPTAQGGGSYNPAAEDKLEGPSKPRCSRWACEWSCLQQARHPWALSRAVFQSDSWSFMFDSPSGPASKHSLKPSPSSQSKEH